MIAFCSAGDSKHYACKNLRVKQTFVATQTRGGTDLVFTLISSLNLNLDQTFCGIMQNMYHFN